MNHGLHLMRVAGIDIWLDWSLLIIFALVSAALGGGLFPAWHPEWSALTAWTTALAAAVLFLVSVLLHELSHALVGRAQGIDIRRITLFIFGGIAHLEHEPEHWRAELLMAIAGPITSLVLGVFCIWLGASSAGSLVITGEADATALLRNLGPWATLWMWLGPVNIMLALFNLVPGFPLDGGRVLRAAIWGATGDLRRATRWASNGGRLFAWLLIGSGFAMILGMRMPVFGAGLVNGLWIALIGWFLHNAALMSYQQLVVREALQDVPLSQLMQTSIRSVPAVVSVEAFVDDYLFGSEQRAFPVVDEDRFVGIVCLEDARKLSRHAWPDTRIQAIMTPADKVTTATPSDGAMETMTRLARRGVNQLPVLQGRRVCGMVGRDDFLRWVALHGDDNAAGPAVS